MRIARMLPITEGMIRIMPITDDHIVLALAEEAESHWYREGGGDLDEYLDLADVHDAASNLNFYGAV